MSPAEMKAIVKRITKEDLAEKLPLWGLLVFGGPIFILFLNVAQKLKPLERGDFYIFDLLLLFACAAEVLVKNVGHRASQSFFIANLMMTVTLVFFLLVGSDKALGANVWTVATMTILTSIVSLLEVVAGVHARALTEVARWARQVS